VTPLPGGDINRAVRVETAGGALFVKWNDAAPPGLFAREAEGLEALRRTGTLRVPAVVAHGDSPAFLALEYLSPAASGDGPAFARAFAEGLAALHSAPPDEPALGFPTDNYLGVLPQANQPRSADWPAFYRDRRLLPLVELARGRGLLPPARERLVLGVVDRLETLLGDLPPTVSLLHGDLWSGNFLCLAGDEPALVDPAVYYGPREMELAFVELFGGFPPGFADLYRAIAPFAPGYERRRPLHQLYPLLVHLAHFGECYGPAVERACRALS
jgi:fructosamine-3-kinase